MRARRTGGAGQRENTGELSGVRRDTGPGVHRRMSRFFFDKAEFSEKCEGNEALSLQLSAG